MVSADRAVCLAPAVTLEPLIAQFRTMLHLPPPVVTELCRRIEAFVGPDFRARARIDVPTLVIHDRDDEMIPCAEGAALAERWPRVTFAATAGLGHRGVLRDPEVITRVVGFVTRSAANA